MKKHYLPFLLLTTSLFAQTGVNTQQPNASLEISSKPTEADYSDGIIPPKLTKANLVSKSTSAYTTNQTGAVIYVTDTTVTPETSTDPRVERIINTGYYYFNGTQWIPFQTPWIPLTNFNGNRSGVYLYSLGDGKERGLREKFNFLDNGRIGFGTNTPSTRLHLSNMRDRTESPSEEVITEKAILTIESFAGAPSTKLMSTPTIKMLQSRGIGTNADVVRPDHGDPLGSIEYVAANGKTTGTSSLTAAKIDVKFRLDTNTNGQKNTADIFFTTSEWLTVNGTPQHSLTTRLSVLGDGKVGVNTSNPSTNLFVQGSIGTSVNVDTASTNNYDISVLGKSTIIVSVSDTDKTISLKDGVNGQRIIIINKSTSPTLTISNVVGGVTIPANKGTEIVYHENNWYALL